MKVAVLGIRGFPNVQGGIETHCENLYPRLAKKGCQVVVFTRKPYLDPAIDTYQCVKLIPLGCPKNKYLEAFLHTLFGVFAAKKIRPDILHIHAIGPSLFVPVARLLGLKVVMTNHGPDYRRKKWGKLAKAILKLGERLGSKWANGVICISELIADDIREKYDRDTMVIPNGVFLPQISENDYALRKHNLNRGKYILSVGRFVPEKGFSDLIEAFNTVRLDKWNLVIVGRADHEDSYSLKLKDKASKNNNIILTGFLTGELLSAIYSHAGLFVLPSYYEGLPIVLLEAMSYGLSCIASDIPANRNVELNQSRYFTPGDVKALATKIKHFTSDPLSVKQKRTQMKMITKKYNWEVIADKTLEIYRQVWSRII